jgi:hypothetical protein
MHAYLAIEVFDISLRKARFTRDCVHSTLYGLSEGVHGCCHSYDVYPNVGGGWKMESRMDGAATKT